MGTSLQLCTPVGSVLTPRKIINMNKFLAVLCLAAGAMADADADPYYAAYGYAAGLPYAGYAGLGYAGYGYAGYPALVAGGYASYSPSASTHIAGLAAPAAPALAGGYAAAGRYVANPAGVVHIAKRSADAEADPYYAAYGYGLGAYGLGYAGLGLGYAGAYGAYPYGVGYAAGYASHSPSAAVNIAGLAPAAAPALGGGYAAAGRYCANSAGVVHCA